MPYFRGILCLSVFVAESSGVENFPLMSILLTMVDTIIEKYVH